MVDARASSFDEWTGLDSLELVVSPFHSFRDIAAFQETVASLAAVRAVRPRRLQRGTLQLRVDCDRADEFLASLTSAYHRPLRLLRQDAHRIELILEAGS